MSDVFLGVIAAAAGVMAIAQIAVLISALIAMRRMGEVLARVEAATGPLLDHVDNLVVDTTESIAAVRAQADRVERRAMDVLARTDQAVHRVQDYLLAPARQGIALAAGARALFGALGGPLSRAFRSTGG
jgi:hypothetical protein